MKIIRYIALFTVISLLQGQALAGNLKKKAMKVVHQATFEVVVPKPGDGTLTYEKELPLDLLPYTVRNDDYYSIGTAFAISRNHLVSAAHVFNVDHESQFDTVSIRDSDGHVYAIDKIIKYSKRRDFVVFTVKDKHFKKYYRTNSNPELNEEVFAVGNALGQGIVIRNGLYTSNTPEQQDGEWNWIRFSAAASPGNSGGPLVDGKGQVIGIVESKSPNENLNFALPISEVLQAPENVAMFGFKSHYRLDNMEYSNRKEIKEEIPLPLGFKELKARLTALTDKFYDGQLVELFDEHKAEIFPQGEGSNIVLYKDYNAEFPHLIAQRADGNWGLIRPSQGGRADLGNNGQLTYGELKSFLYVRVKRPDDVDVGAFYGNPETLMGLLLKGLPMYRWVGTEKVKITSLGAAVESYNWVDHYQRNWQVHMWDLPYNDTRVLAFALPVPDGYSLILVSTETGKAQEFVKDLKHLVDFVYQSYTGTLKQWQEFLAIKSLAPELFSDLEINYRDNGPFKYKSKRLGFSFGNGELPITPDTRLFLGTDFFKEKDQVVWDVAEIGLYDEDSNGALVTIQRKVRPPQSMSDQYRQDWENVLKRNVPYNREPVFNRGQTFIAAIYENGKAPTDKAEPGIVYSVSYKENGNVEQSVIQDKLQKLLKGINIFEK